MSKSIDIEWSSEDIDTFAHTSVMRVDGRQLTSPLQAVHSPHRSVTGRQAREIPSLLAGDQKFSPLVVVGETLKLDTVTRIGYDADVTDALTKRMKERMAQGRVNLVFPRIPFAYHPESGPEIKPPKIDRLRASDLVSVQLDADASLVIPPLPTGLASGKQFADILENTKIEIQTFKSSKEIVGFIPTTNDLELARDMVREYARIGCRFFAVDFSGASNRPALMRSVVRNIRQSLRIRNRAREADEKYYLHIFDIATNKKSINEVAPITDILTHPYGVDSTSGVIWGGSNSQDADKLRYYRTDDYGAYRRKALSKVGLRCSCPICRKHGLSDLYAAGVSTVLARLQIHRLHAYTAECRRISEKVSNPEAKGYVPYLETKSEAKTEIAKIIEDVREIKASL